MMAGVMQELPLFEATKNVGRFYGGGQVRKWRGPTPADSAHTGPVAKKFAPVIRTIGLAYCVPLADGCTGSLAKASPKLPIMAACLSSD